ncbi:MAG: hypothetical protein IPI35_30305 [Deltaproteobacteria bacterium]|nr:hypothetical protein [Deltaproteobacteria bacterium]
MGSHDGAAEVTIALYAVSPEGDTSLMWDLSDPEVYEFGLGGVAAHPDGYYLVCTGDTVLALEPDGSALTPLMTSRSRGRLLLLRRGRRRRHRGDRRVRPLKEFALISPRAPSRCCARWTREH